MEIKSVLVWPDRKDGGPCLGWADGCENKSDDTHHSATAARSICETLLLEGFGCDGHINGIYALEARVEIDGEVVWRCKRRERPEVLKPEAFDERSVAEIMMEALDIQKIATSYFGEKIAPKPTLLFNIGFQETYKLHDTYKIRQDKPWPPKARPNKKTRRR